MYSYKIHRQDGVDKLIQIRPDFEREVSFEHIDYLEWVKENTAEIIELPSALPTTEQKWNIIRDKRTRLLFLCDWTQLLDSPLTEEKAEEWRTYRQALRDITETYATPEEVIYPTPPA